MARHLGDCWTIKKALGVGGYCCSSCHQDDEEGYYSLMERWAGEGLDCDYVTLCCGMTDAFDEFKGDPWPLLRAADGGGNFSD